MGCRLEPSEVPEALWVFNKWVVMRTTDQETYFYEKPTLQGNTEPHLTMDLNNNTMVQDFGTYEFARDEKNSSRCYMYGVKDG